MSQKERLKHRKLPSVTESILVDDPTNALRSFQRAQRVWEHAVRSGDAEQVNRTQAALTRAEKKLDTCYEHIVLRALRPKEYEELIGEHPPTPEQVAEAPSPHERPQWDRETFRPALLAACAENDMTAEDWVEFIEEHAATGEGNKLFVAAIAVNESVRLPEAAMLPKGSALTRSSL